MGWKLKAGAGIIVVGLAAAFFCAPYYTVASMRSALRKNDATALSGYVDYPALRESLKAELNARLLANLRTQQGNPFIGLGLALGPALVNGAVEGIVTPEGLAALLQGRSASAPLLAGPARPAAEPSRPAAGPDAGAAGNEPEVAMRHVGLSTFEVTLRPKGTGGGPLTLVYTRQGLFTWKLTAVRLPVE